MNAKAPIIPVLDLMIGQIVLATGGNRHQYRPVHSKLTHSSRPIDVARAMFLQTGCDCLYLADIDSFAGADPNWRVYRELLDAGFGLWIDANWNRTDRCEQILDELDQIDRLSVILSSETLTSVEDFDLLNQLSRAGIPSIFSLDKQHDQVITQAGELESARPLELIRQAYDRGTRDFIVLDLGHVGTMQGFDDESSMTLSMLREIAFELEDIRLISGGGVRCPEDAQQLLNSGCQHVLVASAIHDCRFTPDCVSQLKPFDRVVAGP